MRLRPSKAVSCLLALVPLSLLACQGDAYDPPPPPVAATAPRRVASDLPVTEGTILAPARRGGAAAMSLTASDGTGLRLVSVVARAAVEGPLALTELKLTFENPENRTREGRFQMTLPAKATVSRLAMKIGDTWQEGEVVEKRRARQAYEDFLHRKQDPALLEQAAGNEVSARVFPIPAQGRKEIVIAYSEELLTAAPFALPIGGLPEIDDVDLRITEGARRVEMKRRGYVPAGDFGVTRAAAGVIARAGDLAVIPVRAVSRAEAEPVNGALVLVDTSASRALGFEAQLALVRDVLGRLGDAPVTVACFDQGTEVVYAGPAKGFGDAELAKIRARGALGASDLGAALAFAKTRAETGGARRVILVGDGVATAGVTSPDELRAASAALASVGVVRVDAVAVGGIRDDKALARLVTADLPHAGIVADAARGPEDIARRLGERALSGVAVEIPGARWSWPRTLDGVQSGDEVLIYAELPEGTAPRAIVGGTAQADIPAIEVPRPLLERAWAKAKIDALVEGTTEATRADTEKEIVALSTHHRVLSPYTSLLVLETERDYARYDIERQGLGDILTIDDGRIVVASRALPADPQPTKAKANAPTNGDAHQQRQQALREASEFGIIGTLSAGAAPDTGNMWGADIGDAFGAGGLGLSGVGEGGGGRGEGIGLGSIGTIGHGSGTGTGQGFGSGHGRLGGSHASSPAPRADRPRVTPQEQKIAATEPYTGQMRSVMDALGRKRATEGLAIAAAWHEREPGDVLALVALGESLEASGDAARAARAYGSLIDLFPARADLRRFASGRLERVASAGALALAVDSYEKAWKDRPDHPSSAHLFAMALLKQGSFERAATVLEEAIRKPYPRFPAADRILREDLGLVAAAWLHAEPGRRAELDKRLATAGALLEDGPSLRFVLTWETDANDVDFHVEDASGGHAFYGHRELESGGQLYADVTQGYGPECFTVRKGRGARSASYALKAHYYARGPMGYGMGKVQIVDHDGHGGIKLEERPFVVMADRAFVDLGTAGRTP